MHAVNEERLVVILLRVVIGRPDGRVAVAKACGSAVCQVAQSRRILKAVCREPTAPNSVQGSFVWMGSS